MNPQVKHCAIYTRKSSEEGLEQDFNSLDAQRESCLAYITSQKAEGWMAVKTEYNDGGFSGGNIERPGLQKLLEDIRAGKVNIIVVYKIDRLTRSLMDFTKLVEIFDQHQVTFVSVTQSFNTTTSMGRLTLNILLSFAQFEREVTGERIRDKILASKKKGMFMGGLVPLGYKVVNRLLVVEPEEAKLVRKIFQSYLRLGSVIKLRAFLAQEGHKTRKGHLFCLGALHWILTNPVYIGKTKHKKQLYKGEHDAIISDEVWAETQKRFDEHPAPRGKKTKHFYLLRGLLYDELDRCYITIHAKKNGLHYRYYEGKNKTPGWGNSKSKMPRIQAQEIEGFVERAIREKLKDTFKLADVLAMPHDLHYQELEALAARSEKVPIADIVRLSIHKVSVKKDSLTIEVKPAELLDLLQGKHRHKISGYTLPEAASKIMVPFQVDRAWKGAIVIRPPATDTPEDIFSLPPHRLKNLVRGIVWRDQHFNGMTIQEIAEREGCTSGFVGRLIRNTLDVA